MNSTDCFEAYQQVSVKYDLPKCFDIGRFKSLALLLQKENVNPLDYIFYVVTMSDAVRKINPERLADPILVEAYKRNCYEN